MVIVPSAVPGSVEAAFAWLKIAADADATAKRLAEITEAQAALDAKQAQVDADLDTAAKRQAQILEDNIALDRRITETLIGSKQLTDGQVQLAKDQQQFEADCKEALERIRAKVEALEFRENLVADREKAVDKDFAKVQEAAAEAAKTKALYEAKFGAAEAQEAANAKAAQVAQLEGA